MSKTCCIIIVVAAFLCKAASSVVSSEDAVTEIPSRRILVNPGIGTLRDTNNTLKKYAILNLKLEDGASRVLPEGWISDLEKLQALNLHENGIKEVLPGLFVNVPSLVTVDLAYNQLKEIKVGVFNGLNVSALNLNHNRLSRIDSDAFDDLPNLNTIDLSTNRLAKWDPRWFKDSRDLTGVYVYSNRINSLPPGAFRNLEKVWVPGESRQRLCLHFSHNQIEKLRPEVFEGLSRANVLFLDHNRIGNINENVFERTTITETLRLNDNRIQYIQEDALEGILKPKSTFLHNNPFITRCSVELTSVCTKVFLKDVKDVARFFQ